MITGDPKVPPGSSERFHMPQERGAILARVKVGGTKPWKLGLFSSPSRVFGWKMVAISLFCEGENDG